MFLVNSFIYGGAANITLGEDDVGNGNSSALANNAYFATVQATASGSINFLTIRGGTAGGTNEPFYLTVYAATSYTNISGALLGQVQSAALGNSEIRTLELASPIVITSGNFYALGILTPATVSIRTRGTRTRDRTFADTYSDGPLGTALAGSAWGSEPIIYGTTAGTDWDGGATMGTTSGSANQSVVANRMVGKPIVAGRDGTISSLTILGSSAASSTVNYRLVIYNVTGPASTWGSKVAETASTANLGISEAKNIALSVPLAVTKGQMYAFSVHADGSLPVRTDTGTGGRFFADTFSDGALGTAAATSDNTWAPIIYGTIA